VWAVPGPVADDAGNVDPAVAPAAHPDHGACSAWRPGSSLRRPQPLACLVLEADVGAQVRRCPFTSSSLNPAIEINAVSGGDRVDQGLELGGRVFVRPGSPPPVQGDGGG
jgi:hypothetical protein